MKKLIVAAFVLGVCELSVAQSSVTIFGLIDAGVARTSATGAGHSTGLESGGGLTSRLGFRGEEDLGGGLKAGFWLEGALNNDTGGAATQTSGLDFTRRSTVSLVSSYGEIRLGRDYTMTYLNMGPFDAFYQRGLGAIENAGPTRGGVGGYVRVSNGVSYFLPENLGGFYGGVQYAFGEQASTKSPISNINGISTSASNAASSKTTNYYGARIGYANGPLNVAGGYGVFQDAVRSVGASYYGSDYTIVNFGASYDFGPIKPLFLYQREKMGGRAAIQDFQFQTVSAGALAPIGAGLIRAQITHYSQSGSSDDINEFALGYIYNLSKRTRLYVDAVRLKNKGNGTFALNNISGSIVSPTPTPGGSSIGYVVGVMHTF